MSGAEITADGPYLLLELPSTPNSVSLMEHIHLPSTTLMVMEFLVRVIQSLSMVTSLPQETHLFGFQAIETFTVVKGGEGFTPDPTEAPTSAPVCCCADIVPNGAVWFDSDGPTYNCKWYSNGSNCADNGNGFENMGYTADESMLYVWRWRGYLQRTLTSQ